MKLGELGLSFGTRRDISLLPSPRVLIKSHRPFTLRLLLLVKDYYWLRIGDYKTWFLRMLHSRSQLLCNPVLSTRPSLDTFFMTWELCSLRSLELLLPMRVAKLTRLLIVLLDMLSLPTVCAPGLRSHQISFQMFCSLMVLCNDANFVSTFCIGFYLNLFYE